MRGRTLGRALAATLLAPGCAAVLGISEGTYDPNPFGDAGDAEAKVDAADADTAAPSEETGSPDAPVSSSHDARAEGAPPADAALPPCGVLIDDLDDGDGWILRCLTRGGGWYTYNDGSASGTQTPLPGRPFLPQSPGHASAYAAHTAGSGFTVRGAGMGFDLNNPSGTRASYDASAYQGLTFWAKASGALHIYVNFPDRDTDPAGGVCTKCNDSYGKGVDITADWAAYTVRFADLSTDGVGAPTPKAFDAAHVYSIEFHTAHSTVFDFWVDDIAFAP
jgi:hypothetical protein